MSFDTMPAVPEPPQALIDAAMRDVPVDFSQALSRVGSKPGVPFCKLRDLEHSLVWNFKHLDAAARWAIHRIVQNGLLSVDDNGNVIDVEHAPLWELWRTGTLNTATVFTPADVEKEVNPHGSVTKLDVIRSILHVHHFKDGVFNDESQSLTLAELKQKLEKADNLGKLTGKSESQLSRDLDTIFPPDGQTTYKALLQSGNSRGLLKLLEPDELKRAFGTFDSTLHANGEDASDAKDSDE